MNLIRIRPRTLLYQGQKVTQICENNSEMVKDMMDKKESLVFNKTKIQKLKTNYSPIEEIKIKSLA